MSQKEQSLLFEQFASLLETFSPCIDDYLYVFDIQNDVFRISSNALERFNLPAEEFTGMKEYLGACIAQEDIDAVREDLKAVFTGEKEFHNMEYRWKDREGKDVWINCRGKRVPGENGHAGYLIGCMNEIGRKQRADNVSGLYREVALSGDIDSLTGKGVVKGFVLRIGIDNFKEINENKGIDYGDMILKETAKCIRDMIVPGQHLYRIVADEFAVSDFTGRTVEDAIMLYHDIVEEINQFIVSNHYEVFYTISGGIVNLDEVPKIKYDNLMKLTEFALNQAKRIGKNQYYVYDGKDYDVFRHKKWLTQVMRKAVNRNFSGFEAYYQPIMDIEEGRLIGAETLLRYHISDTDMVPPSEFVGLLEESSLIVPVGKWVLDQALQACSMIRATIPDFRVSVNVSYIQVLKSNVLQDILQALEEYHLPPGSLMVELTESGLFEQNLRFQSFCNGIKEKGVLLALDDFGTGYSNFHYLYHLSPNTIKIDRSFTIQAIRNEYEYNLLRHMIEMTHGIDLKLCIEGIETEEELAKICSMNPDYIQGFYFGKPCPLEEFIDRYVNPAKKP